MQNMFRCAVVTGLLLVTGISHAQESDTLRLSLSEAIALALDRSGEVQITDLAVETSRVRETRASRARWVPSLEMRTVTGMLPRRRAEEPVQGLYRSPDSTTGLKDLRPFVDVRLEMVQPIFTFGKLSNAIKAARAGVRAAEAERAGTTAGVAFDMVRLYWAMVLADELEVLVADAQNKMTSAEETVRDKLDTDDETVTYQDLWKIQLFGFEVHKNSEALRKERRLAQATARMMLGLPEATMLVPAEDGLRPVDISAPDLVTVIAAARTQRPEIRQLSAALEAVTAKVGVATAQFKPTLFLAGEYRYNYAMGIFDHRNPFQYNPVNFSRPAAVIGMNLNLGYHLLQTELEEARLQQRIVSEQQRRATDGIALEAQRAYFTFREAEANLEHSATARRAGERWQRAAAQNWDLGIGETKDLIDAFKANGTMQAAYREAVFDFNVAAADLRRVMGQKFW